MNDSQTDLRKNRVRWETCRQPATNVSGGGSTTDNPYAFGEAAIYTPHQMTSFHLDAVKPEGPVHFAGEHTSLKHAWIEGAAETAVRAAIEVHERASPPSYTVPMKREAGREAMDERQLTEVQAK